MKKLSVMLAMFMCAASSFAATEVPADAFRLYGYTVDDITGAACVLDLSDAIMKKDSDFDVEFRCQTVYYKWQYSRNTAGVSAQVNVYCQARSYDQKVKFSLARNCEASPSSECFNEKIQAAIQSIQPTSRYEIGKADLEGAHREKPFGTIIRSPYIPE